MNEIGLAFATVSLCLYFAASVVFLLNIFYEEKGIFQIARALLMAGYGVLTILIIGRGLVFGYVPLLTFYETLLFFAWVATLVLLVMERAFQFKSAYYFSVPLLSVLLFLAFFFPASAMELRSEFQSIWLFSHILSVIFAYGTFAVSFVVSIMYLLIDYFLKKKKISRLVVSLPSLDSLDYYNYRLVSVGFFLLTVSIFLGALWANNVWGAFWRWEPKEIWSAVTWIIYAAYLHTRLLSGWQGRKVAMLNTLGFATVLFNYIVVRFFFTAGLHQFI